VRETLTPSEVEQWEILTAPFLDPHILGEIHQGVPRAQPSEVDLAMEDILHLQHAGLLQQCDPSFARGFCRSFAVLEAAKERRRWILHPANFNDVTGVDGQGYFPTVETVIARVRNYKYAVCFDFAWFFGQFPVAPEIGRYFTLSKNGLCWFPKTIPTGARQPPLFCQLLCRAITTKVLAMVAAAGISVTNTATDEFIDNIRFCSDDPVVLQSMVTAFYKVAAGLGATVNEKPQDVQPVQAYDFLGIAFDHETRTVNITGKTRDKLWSLASLLKHNRGALTWQELQKIFGVNIWAATVLASPKSPKHVYYIYKFMRRKAAAGTHEDSIVAVWPSIQEGWLRWMEDLAQSAGRSLLTPVSNNEMVIYTDASKSGWGAIAFEEACHHIVAAAWPRALRREPINFLELKAVRFALQLIDYANVTIRIVVDNTSAQAQLRKGRSPVYKYNDEVNEIAAILQRKSSVIASVEYIKSEHNPADYWSRLGLPIGPPLHIVKRQLVVDSDRRSAVENGRKGWIGEGDTGGGGGNFPTENDKL
jgi:hypothetical protein